MWIGGGFTCVTSEVHDDVHKEIYKDFDEVSTYVLRTVYKHASITNAETK